MHTTTISVKAATTLKESWERTMGGFGGGKGKGEML